MLKVVVRESLADARDQVDCKAVGRAVADNGVFASQIGSRYLSAAPGRSRPVPARAAAARRSRGWAARIGTMSSVKRGMPCRFTACPPNSTYSTASSFSARRTSSSRSNAAGTPPVYVARPGPSKGRRATARVGLSASDLSRYPTDLAARRQSPRRREGYGMIEVMRVNPVLREMLESAWRRTRATGTARSSRRHGGRPCAAGASPPGRRYRQSQSLLHGPRLAEGVVQGPEAGEWGAGPEASSPALPCRANDDLGARRRCREPRSRSAVHPGRRSHACA